MSVSHPSRANSSLGGTDFTGRYPVVLTLIFSEHLSNVHGEGSLGLLQVWSLAMFDGHLFEGKSKPYFL